MAGGVAVPFNTFAEPRELDHLLRHSDVGIVITQSAFLHHRYADEIVRVVPPAVGRPTGTAPHARVPVPPAHRRARRHRRGRGAAVGRVPRRGRRGIPTTSSTPSCARPRRATTASSSTAPGRPPCPRVSSTCTVPPCCRAGATGIGRDSHPMIGCTANSRSSGRPASRRWSERPSRAVPASCCIRCSTATTRCGSSRRSGRRSCRCCPTTTATCRSPTRGVGATSRRSGAIGTASPASHHPRSETPVKRPTGAARRSRARPRSRAMRRPRTSTPTARSSPARASGSSTACRAKRSGRARRARSRSRGSPSCAGTSRSRRRRRSTRRATSTPATPAGSTTAGCSTGPVGSRP